MTTLLNDVSMMTPTAELTSVRCERHSLAGVEHYPTQPIFQRLGSRQLFKQEDHRTIVLSRGKIHAKLTSPIAAQVLVVCLIAELLYFFEGSRTCELWMQEAKIAGKCAARCAVSSVGPAAYGPIGFESIKGSCRTFRNRRRSIYIMNGGTKTDE